MNMGLFYGFSICYTEIAAEKIREILGEDLVDLHNLKDVSPKLMEDYSILILGIPTWNFGELQEDWEAIWPQMITLEIKGKIVAMYGLGDQLDYGEWFLDALGMLHNHISPLGVQFIGFWPTDGFEFTSPKALSADGKHFIGGLVLDKVNQFDISEDRLQQWCEQILLEIEPLL